MECFFSEFKSLMFEGRMDKTAWQRPEFEANNPMFDKNIPKEENHVSVSVSVFFTWVPQMWHFSKIVCSKSQGVEWSGVTSDTDVTQNVNTLEGSLIWSSAVAPARNIIDKLIIFDNKYLTKAVATASPLDVIKANLIWSLIWFKCQVHFDRIKCSCSGKAADE